MAPPTPHDDRRDNAWCRVRWRRQDHCNSGNNDGNWIRVSVTNSRGTGTVDNNPVLCPLEGNQAPGAVPGNHKVTAPNFVVIGNPDGSVTETHYLPAIYFDPTASGLTAAVDKQGPGELTFELTIPGSGSEQQKFPFD